MAKEKPTFKKAAKTARRSFVHLKVKLKNNTEILFRGTIAAKDGAIVGAGYCVQTNECSTFTIPLTDIYTMQPENCAFPTEFYELE